MKKSVGQRLLALLGWFIERREAKQLYLECSRRRKHTYIYSLVSNEAIAAFSGVIYTEIGRWATITCPSRWFIDRREAKQLYLERSRPLKHPAIYSLWSNDDFAEFSWVISAKIGRWATITCPIGMIHSRTGIQTTVSRAFLATETPHHLFPLVQRRFGSF